MAEGEGFEPPVGCPTAVFKTAAFSHSATPPPGADDTRAAPDGPDLLARQVSCRTMKAAMPATAADRKVPHAMSTMVTIVGQPRRVAMFVRS